jgi:hypothetical protein
MVPGRWARCLSSSELLQPGLLANVQALVARLQGPDAGDQASAATELAEQALDDASLCAPIAAAGALPLLVALLRSTDTAAQAGAAGALAALARDAAIRQPIVDAGVVHALVALLRSGTAAGKANAAEACAWLAREAPTRTLIVGAGALPPLVMLLRAGTDDGKKAAADATTVLFDAPTRTLSVDEGALPLLVELFRSGAEKDKTDAARSMGWLTEDAPTPLTGDARRLLLAHASPYYEKLLLGGTAEGRSDIEPVKDLSLAAHRALLGQLRAGGHAALPADLDVRLELLCLAAKVRGAPSGGEGGGANAAARVFERCERALRDSLCADNCLAVLLHLKPYAAEVPELVDTAHAVVTIHIAELLTQPEWLEYAEQYPKSAVAIMQGVVLKQINALKSIGRLAVKPKKRGVSRRRKLHTVPS